MHSLKLRAKMENKVLCSNICNKGGFPKCVIQEIFDSISLDDLIINDLKKTTKVLVCPYNAIEYNQKEILRNENCKECSLCEFVCKHEACNFRKLEKHLLKDCLKLNIFLKSFNTDIIVASTVTAPGNSRTKRLDIVAKNKNKIFLIKVLNNLDKYNFYKRSYQDVIDVYSELYGKQQFIFFALVPSSEKQKSKYSDTVSIEDLPEIFTTR